MTIESWDTRSTKTGNRKVYTAPGGSLVSNTNTDYFDGPFGSQDTVGHPRPYVVGGNWFLQQEEVRFGLISGAVNNGLSGYYVYSQWPCHAAVGSAEPVDNANTNTLNGVLADSNPSRPEVDIPVAIAELGDLHKLADIPIALWQNGLKVFRDPKVLAGGNLALEFGLKPIIQDVNSLLDFGGTLNKRAGELGSMLASGGAKYTRTVLNRTEVGTPVNRGSLGTNQGTLWTRRDAFIRKWIQVSWVPDGSWGPGMPGYDQIRAAAMRAGLGLTIDRSTVWNALPWTWLIDYYANIGDTLAANRNVVGMIPGPCYTMTHTRTQTTHWRVGGQGSYTPAVYYRETKRRVKGTLVGPTAKSPLLSGRQLGILASLNLLTKR